MNSKEDIKALSLWFERVQCVECSEDFKEILEYIGLENASILINLFGGSHVYIPTIDTIKKEYRNGLIYQDYLKGTKFKHIATKYRLSENRVRAIIKEYESGG